MGFGETKAIATGVSAGSYRRRSAPRRRSELPLPARTCHWRRSATGGAAYVWRADTGGDRDGSAFFLMPARPGVRRATPAAPEHCRLPHLCRSTR